MDMLPLLSYNEEIVKRQLCPTDIDSTDSDAVPALEDQSNVSN